MHGLINRGLQMFIRDMYGPDVWQGICLRAKIDFVNFETMLLYPDELTERVITSTCAALGRSREEVLEDFGTYVVSHPNLSSIHDLLKLGGDTYEEFLLSLDDFYDRGQIALPDLEVPRFELVPMTSSRFRLKYEYEKPGYGAVFLGLLRAMADDYGALVLIDFHHESGQDRDLDSFDIKLWKEGWQNEMATSGAGG